MRMPNWFRQNILYLAWAQVLVATLGSLYFSEILRFPPCDLCWYQRILMYPLLILLPLGILFKDKNLPFYILPFSVGGIIVALYQNLLQVSFASGNPAPCAFGVSCTTQYINLFGIITIPFLSLIAFAIITILMIVFLKVNRST